MELNKSGKDLIKSFEGLRLHAYPDPATGGEPYTIGYGSTGSDIHPDTVWTEQQAENRFNKDVNEFAERLKKIIFVTLNDNQFSALVSLAYNIGIANVKRSTLLALINLNDLKGASEQFIRWNRAAGKVVPGLTKRREAEKALFLK